MTAAEEFDEWARDGRDRGMEQRHWHTAKHVLARMPIEGASGGAGDGGQYGDADAGDGADGAGDRVLDLGSGSGYAARAMVAAGGATTAVGIDGAPEMARNARGYTDDDAVSFVVGEFTDLPFPDDGFDHCFSMEAFYYAPDPREALAELRRVLRPGGTFHCAVNYYEENTYSHDWQTFIDVEMTLWSAAEYRRAFRDAGFHVAVQDNVPDRETPIPPESEFPTEEFETRADMVERYRELGTLVTVGVVP